MSFSFDSLQALGMVGGFLSAFATLPQAIKIIRLKKAESVSVGTYFVLVASYVLWLIYGVIDGAVSIVFWNVIALFIGGTVLYLKLFAWKEDKDAD
jgi:uncharacterized protein with PQ loop repeat